MLANVTSGGMRSITFVQAFQYWLKLTALLVPAAVLLVVWAGDRRPVRPAPAAGRCRSPRAARPGLYVTYSLIIATFLGTMGLPHVVVRFYTNPDGRAARRTTLVVLVLLGVFYLLPPIYGALGRIYAPELASSGRADALVLELPRIMVDGLLGEVLTGMVTAGAFAAFLSTSSGLSIAVAGVLSQDVTARVTPARRRRGVPARRGRGGDGAVRRRAAGAQPRRRPRGRAGLRDGGRDLLPAAAARHLVAAASPTSAPSPAWSSAGWAPPSRSPGRSASTTRRAGWTP